jgi:hypothetical protein
MRGPCAAGGDKRPLQPQPHIGLYIDCCSVWAVVCCCGLTTWCCWCVVDQHSRAGGLRLLVPGPAGGADEGGCHLLNEEQQPRPGNLHLHSSSSSSSSDHSSFHLDS